MANTCKDCKYVDLNERMPGGYEGTAMCRYPAPVVQPNPNIRPWPFCLLTDWCSHWTAKG